MLHVTGEYHFRQPTFARIYNFKKILIAKTSIAGHTTLYKTTKLIREGSRCIFQYYLVLHPPQSWDVLDSGILVFWQLVGMNASILVFFVQLHELDGLDRINHG